MGHVVFEWDDVSGDQYRNQLAIIIYDKDQIGYAYHINGTVQSDLFCYYYGDTLPEAINQILEILFYKQ